MHFLADFIYMGFVDLQRTDSYLGLQTGKSCPPLGSNQCLVRPKDWKVDIFPIGHNIRRKTPF